MASAHVATTAVTPRCTRCGLPVRSSVQLRADQIDLHARVLAARTTARSEGTKEAARRYEAVLAAAEGELEVLAAELAGSHLVCPVH